MPGLNFNLNGTPCHLDFAGAYKPGDPRPDGYLDLIEWAEVQLKSKIEEHKCCHCLKFRFEFELDPKPRCSFPRNSRGETVRREHRIYKACAAKEPA